MPVNLRSPPIRISPTESSTGNEGAVAPAARHLAADADDLGLAGLEIALEVSVVFLMLRRRHQQADIAPEDFGFGISEQPFGATVERLDDSPGVDDDDAVGRGVENRVEPFGAGICCGRDPALGVLRGAQPTNEPPMTSPATTADPEQ